MACRGNGVVSGAAIIQCSSHTSVVLVEPSTRFSSAITFGIIEILEVNVSAKSHQKYGRGKFLPEKGSIYLHSKSKLERENHMMDEMNQEILDLKNDFLSIQEDVNIEYSLLNRTKKTVQVGVGSNQENNKSAKSPVSIADQNLLEIIEVLDKLSKDIRTIDHSDRINLEDKIKLKNGDNLYIEVFDETALALEREKQKEEKELQDILNDFTMIDDSPHSKPYAVFPVGVSRYTIMKSLKLNCFSLKNRDGQTNKIMFEPYPAGNYTLLLYDTQDPNWF
ncbi:hypothetical protein PPL_09210 [Heterostelium album PN500]|uniref:Uncharacterized protein n=1 Tax=Heterostelium pallidum (strain ATCC 26659 / Pp 5 / PN500) TaxID=670386 RepID=D3BKX8_HETP5|nr:hypothetical protein PPL_09210 [Heterostelium album PN500]EFA78558.1 hypothetical protein PPL_09210 [Heterostelium album PN500]|eukprot:XP_020430682.1 hypothetical protein PPL_09210 [Heterostelium album PN500]